jgi:hypothetical protein
MGEDGAEPDDTTRAKLEDLFDQEWDEVLVIIETSASKTGRTHEEVIAELLARTEQKVTVQSKVKRGVIRWIGKPWRERENPWEKLKGKVPPPPPARNNPEAADLDEWTPLRPDED